MHLYLLYKIVVRVYLRGVSRMKKRRILVLVFLMLFFIGNTVSSNAMVMIDDNPETKAVHLNHNYYDEGMAGVDGDVYSANGDLRSNTINPFCYGIYFHKEGTVFTTTDDWDRWDIELDETTFGKKFPDLAPFPDLGSAIDLSNQSKAVTINKDTHIGTFTITSKKTITIDTTNGDVHLLVDTLNLSANKSIVLKGSNKVFLYVEQCVGNAKLSINNTTQNPDLIYVISHSYIPVNPQGYFYGNFYYPEISRLDISDAYIVGSVITEATTLLITDSYLYGPLFAPEATVSAEGYTNIFGHVVADNLSLYDESMVTYLEKFATFTVPEYMKNKKYTVNVTADPAGGGTVSPGTTTVNSGETIKITATPASGYTFTGFTSNSTSMIPDDSGNLTVTGNVNIVAHFAQQAVQYDVNVSADPDGAGIVSPTYVRVNSGETITITATPASGYTFTGFTSNNTAMVPDGSGNLTVTGNVNVVAHFEQTINDDYINGILGEYYDDSELHDYALRMKRIDGNISNNFGYAAPVNKNDCIEPNTFSIRWSGYIKPTVTGDYYFKTYSDDGVIVNVNGQTVIENWGLLSLSYKSATEAVHLEAGQYYPITVEYQQLPYYAAVFLFWQADGGQMSLVPEANLYIEKTVYEEYVAYEDMTQYFNQISKNGEGFKNVFYSEDNGGNRVDEYAEISNINYEWRNDAPGSISSDVFYGESDGYLEAKFTEDTTLTFTVDDSIRVWINDNLVIDQWNWNSNRKFSYTFAAEAGTKYKMHIEYMDKGLGATLQMSWSGDALGSEVVPSSYMYAPLD